MDGNVDLRRVSQAAINVVLVPVSFERKRRRNITGHEEYGCAILDCNSTVSPLFRLQYIVKENSAKTMHV